MARPIWLVAALVALAACDRPAKAPSIASAASRGVAPAAGPSSTTAAADPMAAMRAWAQCMRGQGMDVPDPDPNEGKFIGLNPPGDKGSAARLAWERAEGACRSFDTFSEVTQPFTEEQLAAWRAYAQCMRDQGVRMSDPDPAGWPPMPDREDLRSGLADRAGQACLARLNAARHAGKDQ